MVDPRFDLGVTRVTPKQFEKQIAFLVERGYTMQTLSEYLSSGFPAASEKRVCLTFDDAYESVYTYAFPIMARYELPGTVFIISDYVGQYNTWDVNIGWLHFPHLDWQQIRSLAEAGWEIGSHTVSHRDLTRLPASELLSELDVSKKLLERRVGGKIRCLSYPFGKVNLKVAKAAEQAGYQAAVIMNMKNKLIPEKLCVSRLGVYLFDTMISFRQKVFGQAKWIHKAAQRFIGACSTGSIIVKAKATTNPMPLRDLLN